MAEALAIIGLVSSIVQFVDFSSKIVERLSEFQSSLNEVPKTFRDIKSELPLLIDVLKRTESQVHCGDINRDTHDALAVVVEGCRNQVQLLDDILVKTLPKVGDSSWKRGRKAFSSVAQEKRVHQITTTLRNYVQILTYHQATTGISRQAVLPSTVKTVSMVSARQNNTIVAQEKLLEDINKMLRGERCSALTGISGIG
jgi:hypothetical protein